MLSQKRPHNAPTRSDEEENSNNSSAQPNQSLQNQAQDVQSDSDGSSALSIGNKDEFITVALADIRKEVQCPICLGIIRKTRTVMECLHRFCRECIDKSMRLGNNECPACRTHCASRRSLRDDPNYDALISALYPDIDKYEEEELAFHEEERARNKQIQASIAQTLRRQSEALGKKRSSARATAAAYARRSQVYRSYRGRRNQRTNEQQGSDEDEANDYERGNDSSSADEQVTEVKPKRYKRWGGSRFCQNSLAAGSADGGDENDSEANRDSFGASAGLVGNSEMLAWGRGGIRSSTRHGNQSAGNGGKKASAGNGGKKGSAGNGGKKASAGNGKNARNIRLPKLIDANQNTVQNDVLDIHLTLVPLDEQRIPSLQCPHICCSPTASIGHLCQYVGLKTDVIAEEVEIMLVKGLHSKSDPTVTPSVSISRTIDPCKDEMHILEEHETLAELQAIYNLKRQDLLFAYRQKLSASMNSV